VSRRPPSLRFRGVYAARPAPFRIDASRAAELAEGGATLIDVRRGDDPGTELPGAERVAPDELPGRVAEFPRDVPIVLACS
jgi:rhodanese-related sulfurtransferase